MSLYYAQQVDTFSGSTITYVSGSDHSRVNLVGFDGGPYNKATISGMYSLLSGITTVMNEAIDNTPVA
jgi:hypothetical protein